MQRGSFHGRRVSDLPFRAPTVQLDRGGAGGGCSSRELGPDFWRPILADERRGEVRRVGAMLGAMARPEGPAARPYGAPELQTRPR